MKIKNSLSETRMMFFILTLAFVVRIQPFRFPYLLGVDTYYYGLKWTNHILNGLPLKDNYVLLPYAIIGFYSVFKFFGLSLINAIKLFPAIMGALTIIPLYLISKSFYGKRAGMFSALLLAISLTHSFKTIAGLPDKDVIWMPLDLFALYFFIKNNKDFKYPLLSGLFLGFASYAHEMYLWSFFLIALVALLRIYLEPKKESTLRSFIIASVSGLLIAVLWGNRFAFPYRYVYPLSVAIVALAILLSLIYLLLLRIYAAHDKKQSVKENKNLVFALLIIIAFVSVVGQIFLTAANQFTASMRALIQIPFSETQPSTLGDYLKYLSTSISFVPIGLYYIIRRRTAFDVFAILWVFLSLTLSKLMIIFMFILAPPTAIVGGLGLGVILEEVNKAKAEPKWATRKLKGLRFSIIFAIILALSINFATTASTIYKYEPTMNDARNQALLWLKENTPKDSVIMCSYYDGSVFFVEAIAERKVFARSFDKIVTSVNDSEIQNFLIQNEIDYIYADQELYGMFYSFIAPHLDVNPNEYSLIESNSLLFKMLYPEKQKIPEYIQMTFKNEQVMIYKVISK